MKYFLSLLAALTLCIQSSIKAQTTPLDLARINTQGFQHSQVMSIISALSDEHGPRLTGTRKYHSAALWAKEMLESWGMDRVYFEGYCDDCMGWEVNSFNVEMIAPDYMKIMAYPYAWTQGTEEVESELVFIGDYRNLEKVKETWSGKLKGKAVLIGNAPKQNLLLESLSTRFTEEELKGSEKIILPEDPGPFGYNAGKMTLLEMEDFFESFMNADNAFFEFLKSEGVTAAFDAQPRFPGVVHPSGTYNYKSTSEKPIPYFSIAPEHFGKMKRLLDKGITPKLQFHSNTEMYLEPENNVNILAELTGSDPKLKDEIVMIGAHFDSWHSGSGATDNGAGSAVMMEVMRILKASGLKPKRTIRIGLWGGEEQGYLGSYAYAKNHFGNLKDKAPRKKETGLISAYLNMDNGAGVMKGLYLQGNEAVRDVFEKMLTPYAHLDVDHLTIQNTNFTDHDVFDYYGIPAFQIIQDPLNYNTVTHHTDLDVLEYVPERDMMINATVLAALVYQIAMMDNALPRKQ